MYEERSFEHWRLFVKRLEDEEWIEDMKNYGNIFF